LVDKDGETVAGAGLLVWDWAGELLVKTRAAIDASARPPIASTSFMEE
jgi:hypothetical protein